MVLLRDGGGMVDVRYSASCGGHGEDNDAIWGGAPDPSLRGRRDVAKPRATPITSADDVAAFLDEDPAKSWCGKSKLGAARFRWTARVAAADLERRIAADLPAVGRLKSLEPKLRGVSGRIRTITIRGDKASVEVSGDLRIRRLLGGLRSSLFEVRRDGDHFVFRGAGFGHGVGMCQMGAIGMAEAGKRHVDILRHYYPSTHVHRLY
jgi:SpoIID/LytB domain protein